MHTGLWGSPRCGPHKAAAKALLGPCSYLETRPGKEPLTSPFWLLAESFPHSCTFHSIFSNPAEETGHRHEALIYGRVGPSFLFFVFLFFDNCYSVAPAKLLRVTWPQLDAPCLKPPVQLRSDSGWSEDGDGTSTGSGLVVSAGVLAVASMCDLACGLDSHVAWRLSGKSEWDSL